MTISKGQWIVCMAAILAAASGATAAQQPWDANLGDRTGASHPWHPATASAGGGAAGLEAERVVSASRPGPATGPENVLLRRDGAGPLDGWGRTVLALAIVLAVLLVLRSVLKRLGRRGAAARGGAMDVLARTSVSPRQQLLLVRLGSKLILMGSSPAGLSALHVVSDPEEVAELTEAAMGGGAEARLRAEAGKHREGGG